MKIKFLLVIIFSLFTCIGAQTNITGTLLGYDGKPMQIAHVSIYNPSIDNSRVISEVGKDGSYSLTINEKGPYYVNYVGLNHQGESVLLATENFVNEKIDVLLELKKFPASNYPNQIIGDFNGFNQSKAVAMKKTADSTYSAIIETKEDKIKFIIIVGMFNSTNGTQPAEYEFDTKKGIYLTVLNAVDGKVEVNFDPAKLPVSDSKAGLKFEKESQLSRIAQLKWDYSTITKEFMSVFLNSTLNNKKNTYDLAHQIKKFSELFNSETDPLVKQVIVLIEAELAALSTSRDDFKEDIANRLIKEVKLDSYLLKMNPGSWIGTVFEPRKAEIGNEKLRRAYVEQFLETSSLSNEDKAKLILTILQGVKLAHNEPMRKKYYAMMMDKYADTESAKKAKEFSDEFQLGPGSPVPKFSLVSHDDPKVTFTNESFKGKKYLIDFWATWCGPCKAEMPELHKVYQKFKDKGFEILSISFDQTEDAINKYRQGEWKMPWLHAFVDGDLRAKIAKDFDAAAIPKPFLVDGNTNRILALTTDLRGENLEETLEKFIK